MQESVPTAFGRQSTADEVAAGHDLTGKLVVLTGASAGLGEETARTLGAAGADLFLGARRVNQLSRSDVKGTLAPLDLMSVASAEAFGDAVLALDRPVDLLILNAGIMAAPYRLSEIGVESQLMTNYVGHAVLTSRLAPALKARGARVVVLSSTGHHISPVVLDDLNFERRPYDPWAAYGQSKTACSLLALHVAERAGDQGVSAFAVHPGRIKTELQQFMNEEDQARAQASRVSDPDLYKSTKGGAATSVWAAVTPALAGTRFAYLEDCQVAPIVEAPNGKDGVMRYALDAEAAGSLWAAAERFVGRPLPL